MGLVLNQERVNLRKAHRIRDGIVTAFSKKLDKSWFEAIANSTEEAAFMQQVFERSNTENQ